MPGTTRLFRRGFGVRVNEILIKGLTPVAFVGEYMAKSVGSLPSRPLTKSEVLSMKEAREYCIRPESDEAFVLSLLSDTQVHALGFRR